MQNKYQEPIVKIVQTIPTNVLLLASGEGDNDGFADDFIEDRWFKATVYEYTKEQRREIEGLLSE